MEYQSLEYNIPLGKQATFLLSNTISLVKLPSYCKDYLKIYGNETGNVSETFYTGHILVVDGEG